MRTRPIALLLTAALLLTLAGCGAPRRERGAAQDEPQRLPDAPAPAGAEALRSVEAAFPLLSAPLSEAESEEMVNHNARRCAMLAVNYYYCRCLYADGSCALVRYEIVDNVLRHRTRLVPDCPADFLCQSGERLYYLGADRGVESVSTDGGARRRELDAPCLSLQLHGGTLYCLRRDGVLLALRGGAEETLLEGCSWAFVTERGIFYTAAADGRAHLFDPAARTDMTLSAEAALSPTLIGTTLYYTADEEGARRLCALELTDGTRRRMETAFTGEAEFLRGWDGEWQLRVTGLGGAAGQQLLPLGAAFDGAQPAQELQGAFARRCRGLDDVLHTDELLGPDGESLGFELVLPGGLSIPSLAADNPPED